MACKHADLTIVDGRKICRFSRNNRFQNICVPTNLRYSNPTSSFRNTFLIMRKKLFPRLNRIFLAALPRHFKCHVSISAMNPPFETFWLFDGVGQVIPNTRHRRKVWIGSWLGEFWIDCVAGIYPAEIGCRRPGDTDSAPHDTRLLKSTGP
jgi:hypothetical protein